MIRKMPVIVPPMQVSLEIIADLHEQLAAVTRLTEPLNAALQRSQTLRRALLTAAFAGKLAGRDSDQQMIETAVANERAVVGAG